MSKAWKLPSSRPILIYFEFRSKSFAWTLTRPTNYLRQNIVFSYSEMSFFFLIISLFFFFFFSLSLFFFFLFYVILLLLIFTKTMLLLSLYLINFFFNENYLYFCMFRDVSGCSWMFRNVPGCSMFLVLLTPPSFLFSALALTFMTTSRGNYCLRQVIHASKNWFKILGNTECFLFFRQTIKTCQETLFDWLMIQN